MQLDEFCNLIKHRISFHGYIVKIITETGEVENFDFNGIKGNRNFIWHLKDYLIYNSSFVDYCDFMSRNKNDINRFREFHRRKNEKLPIINKLNNTFSSDLLEKMKHVYL